MSEAPAKRSPLWMIVVVGIVVVADAAWYKDVFRVAGPIGGTIFLVAGSIFVIWCVWWMERREQ